MVMCGDTSSRGDVDLQAATDLAHQLVTTHSFVEMVGISTYAIRPAKSKKSDARRAEIESFEVSNSHSTDLDGMPPTENENRRVEEVVASLLSSVIDQNVEILKEFKVAFVSSTDQLILNDTVYIKDIEDSIVSITADATKDVVV